jgi:hypothetical protein
MNIIAVKDIVTIDQYYKRENRSEDKINRLRDPARHWRDSYWINT